MVTEGLDARPREAGIQDSVPMFGNSPRDQHKHRFWLLVAGLAVLIVGWAVLGLISEGTWFAVVSPKAQVGVEAAAALGRLFSALVLLLFPSEERAHRMRWVAAGLVVMAVGSLLFGYVAPLLASDFGPNTSMYGALVVRTLSSALIAIGLYPRQPAPLTRRIGLITLGAFAGLSLAVVVLSHQLPFLIRERTFEELVARRRSLLPVLTPWHFALALVPLGLSVLGALGAIRRFHDERLEGWLVIAMVLAVGSQLHYLFWPTTYSTVLTSSDVLRLAFAAVVAVGAVVELRRIAVERAALLAAEQEQTRRLKELSVLRADFTAMVAHELGNPAASIRGFADVLLTGALDPQQQAEAINVIRSEAGVLTAIIGDMQTAATVERDDFSVQLRPVRLSVLVADAATYGRALPGDHPFTVVGSPDTDVMVLADSFRIRQVLRNLLSNAAKYTPAGRPIELHVSVEGRFAHLEVCDHGDGIAPDEISRIFEKFRRGRDVTGRKIPGVGLGLYLSRRIVQAHGDDLDVRSTVGAGSTFGFELEVVQ